MSVALHFRASVGPRDVIALGCRGGLIEPSSLADVDAHATKAQFVETVEW